MSLKSQTAKGSAWTIGSALFNQVVQFITFTILAWILTPADFGLMALAMFSTSFIRMFLDMGMGMAIIQKKVVSRIQLSSVFWVGTSMSLILFVTIHLLADHIGKWSGNPQVAPLLHWLNLIFIIDSVKLIPGNLLSKTLKFKSLAITTGITAFTSAIVSIPCALLGYGVYSLVYGFLFSSAVTSVLLFFMAKWRPHFEFSWKETKELLKFGISLTGSSFIAFISDNLERFFLAKYMGATSLGIYYFSSKLINWPRVMISQNVGKVILPVFSRVQDDRDAFKKAYLYLFKMLTYFSLPLMILLAITCDIWIPLIFSSKWIAAISPFRILVFAGILSAMISPLGNVYLAKGKSYISLIINGSIFFAVIIGYPIVTQFGLIVLCLAVVLKTLIGFIFVLFYCSREVKSTFLEHWNSVKMPVFLTFLLSAIILSLRWIVFLFKWNSIFELFCIGLATVITTFLFIKFFEKTEYKNLHMLKVKVKNRLLSKKQFVS